MSNIVLLIIKKIKDASFLFYIIIYNFMVKNLFLNLVLIFVLILIDFYRLDRFFGPFISAILTFNLVNGYSYYNKYRNWNKIKDILLMDIHIFILIYIQNLNYNYFPLHEKNAYEHENIDKIINKIYTKLEADHILILDRYEIYFTKLLSDKNIKLKYNKMLMNRYLKLFFDYKNKINNNINISIATFSENYDIISDLAYFKRLFNEQIEIQKSGVFKDNNKYFLLQTINFIIHLKKLIRFVLKQEYYG